MTWVKLDDQFPDHPKTEEAGPFAAWLFVCSLCYCAEYLTDGFVPATKAARLANIPTPAKHISKLVDVGLWEPVEGGYRVHDYHDYQPTAEKVKAERKAAAERMNRRRTGRPKDANERECSGVSSGEHPPNEERSSTVPFPSLDVPNGTSPKTPAAPDLLDGFDAFWEPYPRKVEKAAARSAWKARRKAGVSAEEMIQASENYADACAVRRTEPAFVKHPATFIGVKEPWKDYLDGGEALAAVVAIDPRSSDDPGVRAAAYGTFIADRSRPAWMDPKGA